MYRRMVWSAFVDALTFIITFLALAMLGYLALTIEARAGEEPVMKGRPDVIYEINLIRRKNGMLPVMETPFLEGFSQKRAAAAWPYRYRRLADAHSGFYASVKHVPYRAGIWLGENLYTGPVMATGREIAVAWMNSPSHRAVILHVEAVSCSAGEVIDDRQAVVALNCAGE